MRLTLQAAADYIRIGRASKLLQSLINRAKTIITFTQEHANRLPRYIRVVRAYKAGKPIQDIEKEFGCSRSTVLRYARLAQLPPRPKGFDARTREAVITMYKDQKPLAEIQAHLGVSLAYISTVATEEGINRRKFKKGRHQS